MDLAVSIASRPPRFSSPDGPTTTNKILPSYLRHRKLASATWLISTLVAIKHHRECHHRIAKH